jgi:hypothetical protein
MKRLDPSGLLPFLPLLYLLGAWTSTTAAGAAIILLPGGTQALARFLGGLWPGVADDIGNPTYLTLLVAPFLMWPVTALAGLLCARAALRRTFRRGIPDLPVVDGRLLWTASGATIVYCLIKLGQAGGLVPTVLISGQGYNEQMIERVRLMDEMRFTFYAVTYAVVPALAALFFARFLERRHWSDLAGFGRRYLSLIGGADRIDPLPVAEKRSLDEHTGIGRTVGVSRSDPFASQFNSAAFSLGQSVIFRMGASFPFYVSIFEDPAERCGIESNWIPLLPRPSCDIPTKVFGRMYPGAIFVQGFSPAAAHVSAYGEVGLMYAISIMALAGFSVGVLGALSTAGQGPFFAVLLAASCVFAYYLTQVPFLGALTYGHGLAFFVLPLVPLAIGSIRRPSGELAVNWPSWTQKGRLQRDQP